MKIVTCKGVDYAEGESGEILLPDASAVTDLIEFCFNHRTRRVLLHARNLSSDFFQLKSGMAGIVLEKCRQYGIRVAIVLDAGQEIGDRFRELIAEENRHAFAHFTPDADAARVWLAAPATGE